jgi:hypothetical protein
VSAAADVLVVGAGVIGLGCGTLRDDEVNGRVEHLAEAARLEVILELALEALRRPLMERGGVGVT